MSWIEGIGDEVVEFFFAVIVILIGTVAWCSTRITDIPLPAIRTVVVLERRTRRITENSNHQNLQNNTNVVINSSEQASQSYVSSTESEENKPPSASTSVETNSAGSDENAGEGDTRPEIDEIPRDLTPEEEEQNTIISNMDSSDVVRRRRLDFFSQSSSSSANNERTVGDVLDETTDSNTTEKSSEPNSKSNGTSKNVENTESETKTYKVEEIKTDPTAVEEDRITIKLKYINDDLKLVNGNLKELLGDFRRRNFESEISNNKLVRLIFNGQVLQRDEMTLERCGLFDNCVVHCLVHQRRINQSDQNSGDANVNNSDDQSSNSDRSRLGNGASRDQPREWDLGNLFFIIVSFFLGAAWYFRYEYAQLYTVTATMALVGLTGIFTVLLVGMYFPDPEPVQPPTT